MGIVVVTAVTLFSNLALAVGCGLLINLPSFAIRSSEEVNLVRRLHVPKSGAEVSLSIDVATDDDRDVDGDAEPATVAAATAGTTIYEVDGPLFFGSIKKFLSLFDIDNDYANVELHCASMAIIDFSATEALVKLGSQYAEKKKRLHLKNVHPDNQAFLRKCKGMIDGDSLSDTWKEPYTAVEGTVPAVPAAPSMVVPKKDLKIWGQELQSRPALCFV